MNGETAHARFIAKNRAAGPRGRRINGQNRHPMSVFRKIETELVDKGRFADPRQAGNADAVRASRIAMKRLEQLVREPAVIGFFTFDQRNGPA
jgi:hypothetical protein